MNASSPPAEAPTPTMGGELPSARSSPASRTVAALPCRSCFSGAVRRFGRRRPAGARLFASATYFSPGRTVAGLHSHRATSARECHCANCADTSPNCSAIHTALIVHAASSRQRALGTCQQILDDLADLHELIQTGRLGDESGNSEVLEQSLVSPGLGRTPHAHWNAGEVSGASDLAQDVFAGILGQVQVHQDQVWNCRLRVAPAGE